MSPHPCARWQAAAAARVHACTPCILGSNSQSNNQLVAQRASRCNGSTCDHANGTVGPLDRVPYGGVYGGSSSSSSGVLSGRVSKVCSPSKKQKQQRQRCNWARMGNTAALWV